MPKKRKRKRRAAPAERPAPAAPRRDPSTRARDWLGAADRWVEAHLDVIMVAILVAGFLIRLRLAGLTYFEMDEAYHARLSIPGFPKLWYTAHEPTHPPLLIFILHFVRKIGTSEITLRMVPVVAGAIFPWFIYRWVGLVWNRTTGLLVAVILVFSPTLAHLSAVVRQYTLGLLFLAIALYLFERSIRSRSATVMAGFALALWLAVASTFPAAFYLAAMAVYALLRFRDPSFTRRLKAIWAGSQVVALGMYTHFLFWQVIPLRKSHLASLRAGTSVYAQLVPGEGDNPLVFSLVGAFRQFELVFRSSTFVAGAALALFLGGVAVVFFQRSRIGRRHAAAIAGFLLIPFVLMCLASFAQVYPWGKSRQTIFIALSIGLGIGIAADWMLRRRAAAALVAVALLVPWWIARAEFHQLGVNRVDSREIGREMFGLLRERARGERILIESGMHWVVAEYLGGEDWPGRQVDGEVSLNGYRWSTIPGSWSDLDSVWRGVREYRKRSRIPDGERIWILDAGGWCELCDGLKKAKNLPIPAGDLHLWKPAAALFPVTAGQEPSE